MRRLATHYGDICRHKSLHGSEVDVEVATSEPDVLEVQHFPLKDAWQTNLAEEFLKSVGLS